MRDLKQESMHALPAAQCPACCHPLTHCMLQTEQSSSSLGSTHLSQKCQTEFRFEGLLENLSLHIL